MSSQVLTSLVALVASLFLTRVVRSVAWRYGCLDQPDGKRKLHDHPRPLLGGVAVYLAMVISLFALRFCPMGMSRELVELSSAWMMAAACVCFVGSIDDIFNLPSRLKLLLQIISVLPIVFFGYSVNRVVMFGYPIELGWFGIPLTVFWLVGCINALNLIDGMDGLASIVGLSAATMMGVIAASSGHNHVAMMAIVLAGALAGFLIYNLPPASIFLGDSGSMVIGLTVGVLGMQGALKTTATLAITAPAVVMTLPIFDILAALVRRKLTGRRFDTPDRLHIHHRLLARGWTPWQVLCLIGSLCLTTGAAATAATIFRRDALAWIAAITTIALMIRLRLFGYEEFAMVKAAIRRTVLRGTGMMHKQHKIKTNLDSIDINRLSCTEAWDLLIRDVPRWRIRQVELTVMQNQQPRRIRWFDPTMPVNLDCHWSLAVSLPNDEGDLCELRVASCRAVTEEPNLITLTSLLKTYGLYFSQYADEMFGPPTIAEDARPTQKHSMAA
jgi:UDP-GlcNAc:undecaprenyl-phosphate GlcNAc-1-phosphate transferase